MIWFVLAGTFASFGCSNSEVADSEIAKVIELRLLKTHRDIELERFARFYSHVDSNHVEATFLFANAGYQPIVGQAGHAHWVSPDQVPRVMDGGCSVINIRYHVPSKTIVSMFCNGDA